LQEPLVPQLGHVAALDQIAHRIVGQFFECGIVLADHDGNGLHGQHFANDLEISGILGVGDVASQDRTVHHERVSTTGIEQQEAVRVVLAKDFLEVHAVGTLMLAQQLHRSGAGGGGHVLVFELCNRSDARSRFHSNADFFHVRGDHKSHVFLTCRVVGGRAALDVHRAVLHQRNAVLRRHRLELHVDFFAHGFFHIANDALADFVVETSVLAITQGVGQSARRIAHTHGNGAGGFDFGNGVSLSAHAGQCGHGHSNQLFFHQVLQKTRQGRKFDHAPTWYMTLKTIINEHDLCLSFESILL
jgi:hypothetical protein